MSSLNVSCQGAGAENEGTPLFRELSLFLSSSALTANENSSKTGCPKVIGGDLWKSLVFHGFWRFLVSSRLKIMELAEDYGARGSELNELQSEDDLIA